MSHKIVREAEGIHDDLHFVVVFNELFIRCGYVGVPKGHPLFGKDYDDLPFWANCHGGLTYAGTGGHFVNSSEESELWWFGFDCGHAEDGYDLETGKKYFPDDADFVEKNFVSHNTIGRTIRTTDYVIENCKILIYQINEYTSEIK